MADTKERPILFSASMVRAILEGRKSQTRRVVRLQFDPDAEPEEMCATTPEGWQCGGHSGRWWDACEGNNDKTVRCPYGQPGDRLWLRENWRTSKSRDNQSPQEIYDECWMDTVVEYRADGSQSLVLCEHFGEPPDEDEIEALSDFEPGRWRASIHMPCWASRILLEVVSVRVERLQDISEEDALAEGLQIFNEDGNLYYSGVECKPETWLDNPESWHCADPVGAFRALWQSTNGPGSWDANPWVWVVEFRRIER